MKPLILSIAGMSCGHCLNTVNQALGKVPGIKVGSVRMGRAEIEFDETTVTPESIIGAVSAAGYRADVIQ